MNLSKVYSAQTYFLKAHIIDIEVDLSRGLHAFSIIGLPDKAVEEARDRISAAIKNTGFASPKSKNHKVVIALAPADLKKEGPIFDLAMAIGYLLASGEISFNPQNKLFLGELSLDGSLRSIQGILPLISEAKKRGFTEVYLPLENAVEAALIDSIKIFGAHTLQEVIDHINEKKFDSRELLSKKNDFKIKSQKLTKIEYNNSYPEIDFSDIVGQESAKRGLEIAAAGKHNISLYGPPGTGKTMLAKASCHILPDLPFESILDVTSIYSIAGLLKNGIITKPPFRSPHHTASYISLVGGGTFPKPGEITLAHHGILFMDEFPEFERRVIDSLRQPLEEKTIQISRVKGTASFPANFILIAAMNPCPCGNYGSKNIKCICSASQLIRYQRKISGPIIDRIDIWTEVSHIDPGSIQLNSTNIISTKSIKEHVSMARTIQKDRFKNHERNITTNSEMNSKDIIKFINMSQEAKNILDESAKKLLLSVRAYHKVMKMAQTIADLSTSNIVTVSHVLEAIQYRPKKNT